MPKARRVYRKAAEVGERFDYLARDALGECCRGVALVLLEVSFETVRWEVGDRRGRRVGGWKAVWKGSMVA